MCPQANRTPATRHPAAHPALTPASAGRLPDGAGALAVLRAIVRNPIEVVPDRAYRQGIATMKVLGRTMVFVTDPDLVRTVLTDSASFGQSTVIPRALGPLLGNGVLTAQGPHWRNQRRVAAPAFRNQRVLSILPAMSAAGEAACDRMLAQPGGRVNVGDEMMRTTLAVILAALLPSAAHVDAQVFGAALTRYLDTSSWVMALCQIRAPAWTPYPGQAGAMRAAARLRALVRDIVRNSSSEDDGTMLGLLRSANDPDTGDPMSETELVDNLLTFVAAGHETTATTLAWALYRLSLHPVIRDEILAEIAERVPHGPIDEEGLASLALTRRVIKETMRLYPAAPLLVRTPLRATALGDVKVKPGDAIYLPIYALHRHHSVWSDAEQFDPDRFLPDQEAARHRYAYLPFGAGPRVCMGASFAMTEAVVLLATILRRVRFTPAEDCHPVAVARVTLRPRGGIHMSVEAR